MKKEADIRDSVPVVRDLLSNGASIESALAEMRAAGYGQAASAHILRLAAPVPLKDAKAFVFNSATWADKKKAWETAQADAEVALRPTDRRSRKTS